MPRLSHHDLRRNFRELLNADRCFHTASVFDPMSARIAADLGFEVGILGGSVASLQVLAAPDFNLITLSEFVEQVNGHAAYFAAIKATYDCLREQRQVDALDLNASQLSVKYSTADEYVVWAEEYMQVKE
jgi:2-methylisocitrate lyase-like PEP mutase family enzyme